MLWHGRKQLRKAASYLLSVSMFLGYTVTPEVMCATISENENSKLKLKEKKKALNKELQEASKKVRKEANNKEALDNQIKVVQSQIDVSNSYIYEIEQEISEMEKQIAQIQEEMKQKIVTLKKVLATIYVAGDTSTIDIILGAKNFEDFIDKVDIVRSVSQTIKKMVDDLQNDLDKIKEKQKEITANKEEKEKEKENLEKSRGSLQELYGQSEKLLSELEESEKQVKREIDLNDSEIKAIDAQIQKYYEEQKRLMEEKSSGKVTPPHVGGFTWPVPGYRTISSGFNDTQGRAHMHGAIDIAGAGIYGQKVVASGSGKVIIASCGWGGGYGNYVVIDHGNGRSTLYGHMSNIVVKSGQSVSAGQQIGNVGSTGISTGPHLHFEYRVNGVRTNPSAIVSY